MPSPDSKPEVKLRAAVAVTATEVYEYMVGGTRGSPSFHKCEELTAYNSLLEPVHILLFPSIRHSLPVTLLSKLELPRITSYAPGSVDRISQPSSLLHFPFP